MDMVRMTKRVNGIDAVDYKDYARQCQEQGKHLGSEEWWTGMYDNTPKKKEVLAKDVDRNEEERIRRISNCDVVDGIDCAYEKPRWQKELTDC